MKENLFFATAIDIAVFLICTWTLFRFVKPAIYHPASTYLVFHIFAFTSRLIFLSSGAAFFLGGQTDYFTAIENHEIVRATLLADAGFIAMTWAWIQESKQKIAPIASKSTFLLRENVLKIILCITIPLGILGVLTQLYIPGIRNPQRDFGFWSGSGYILNTQNWLVLSYLIIIFKYGFRPSFLIITALLLLLLALQGELRYRILIPSIFLLFLYLYRNQKQWMSLRMTFFLMLGGLVFLPLKYIGKLIQNGADLADLIEFSTEYRESLSIGANADFSFLDMYASILSLIDQHGNYFYGSTYLNLLLAPIPRQFWDTKPSLVQWMTDISSPSRNLRELGAIATIYGESYANFGYLGIIIIPFLFAKYSGRWYNKIRNSHPQSVNLYLYLYFSATLIQVYRDGLSAIFMFLVVYNMPGFFACFFSLFKTKTT